LASQDLALLFADGWIAVAYADSFRVDWRSSSGEWIRGALLPFIEIMVSDRQKCASMQELGTPVGRCNHRAIPSWPQRLPPFLPISSRSMSAPGSQTLLATADGRLAIRRTPVAGTPTNRYDFVDRRGALQGIVRLAANEAIVGFSSRSVYVVETNGDGVQRLRRHPWP
jgi:hypothetical protein